MSDESVDTVSNGTKIGVIRLETEKCLLIKTSKDDLSCSSYTTTSSRRITGKLL